MNNQNQSSEVKMKKHRFISMLSTILGIIFLIIGLVVFPKNAISAICLILASFILISPIWKLIQQNIKVHLKRSVKVLIVLVFFSIAISVNTNNQTENLSKTTHSGVEIGQNAYLRFPEVSTQESQLICLSGTKEGYAQVMKSIRAKDAVGLLEIPGAFCVQTGVKVLVIDKSVTMTRVKILEAYQDIDKDKVGISGWLPYEWVSKE